MAGRYVRLYRWGEDFFCLFVCVRVRMLVVSPFFTLSIPIHSRLMQLLQPA